jgi:hypothetical protein
MGDIPERGTFRQPVLRKALEGYFEIVKGDKHVFLLLEATANSGDL